MPPKKPKPNVRVSTMESEFDFTIVQSTRGMDLFDSITESIGLREVTLFGIQYTDSLGHSAWLKLNKRVMDHDLKKEFPFQFNFLVKYFPEDVEDDVIQPITLKLFYLQIKNSILSDEIYCPPDTSVLLASYAAQIKHGDYEKELETKLSHERLLSERVLNQHNFSRAEWDERIMSWWKEHAGMKREQAMLEYLKTTENLDMYGISYFQIKNRKGTQLWLGVDALGLNIYSKSDKLTPKIAFPWSEINKIMFKDTRFIIRLLGKNVQDFIFLSSRLRFNKRILAICIGNHELFLQRRRNVGQALAMQNKWKSINYSTQVSMRSQASHASSRDNEKLEQEIFARQQAEQKQIEYEKKMEKMKTEMERWQNELIEAQDTIQRLEDELRKLREAKQELEDKQFELEELIIQLETNEDMQVAERQRLEETIRLKQDEVERIREEVRIKDEEAKKLQEEVDHARRQKAEAVAGIIHLDSQRLIAKSPSSTSESEDDTRSKHKAKSTKQAQAEGTQTDEQQQYTKTKITEEERETTKTQHTKYKIEKRHPKTDKKFDSRSETDTSHSSQSEDDWTDAKESYEGHGEGNRGHGQDGRGHGQDGRGHEYNSGHGPDSTGHEYNRGQGEGKWGHGQVKGHWEYQSDDEDDKQGHRKDKMSSQTEGGHGYDKWGHENYKGHGKEIRGHCQDNSDSSDSDIHDDRHQTSGNSKMKNEAEEAIRYQAEVTAIINEEASRKHRAEATGGVNAETAKSDVTPYKDKSSAAVISSVTRKEAAGGNKSAVAAIIGASRNPNARPYRPEEHNSLTLEGEEGETVPVPYYGVHQNERERNSRLKASFRKLTQELAEKRDDEKETPMDKIHYNNVSVGRDKYGSLREVRRGDTKRRVDFFENM